MAGSTDPLAGLRPEERERLDRFSVAFERLDASQYVTFAELPTPEVEAAEAEAAGLLGTRPRRDAVKAAVAAFVDEATRAYSRRPTLTDTLLMFQSLPDRAEDRVRFLASVERAVVALILWDELSEQSRAALLGLWRGMADPIITGDPEA